MALDTDRPARPTAVALVRWPGEAERRDRCADAGLLCLLVVEPGEPIPLVGRGEDWVYQTSDERDVSARIDKLRRSGGRLPSSAPVALPTGLSARQRRVASRLIGSCGMLVRRSDLVGHGHADLEELDAVIASLRESLAADGWRISAVGRVGFVVDRLEARLR